jgi:hypothetical protein
MALLVPQDHHPRRMGPILQRLSLELLLVMVYLKLDLARARLSVVHPDQLFVKALLH